MCLRLGDTPAEWLLEPGLGIEWSETSRVLNILSGEITMLSTVLLVVLVLLLLGAFPTWPHSRRWGYAPSGTLGTILLIVLILVLMGRL